jgi:hypothetical protein
LLTLFFIKAIIRFHLFLILSFYCLYSIFILSASILQLTISLNSKWLIFESLKITLHSICSLLSFLNFVFLLPIAYFIFFHLFDFLIDEFCHYKLFIIFHLIFIYFFAIFIFTFVIWYYPSSHVTVMILILHIIFT